MELITESEEPKSRAYIREWKRQNYLKNGEEMKATQRAYYYKYKNGMSDEEMHRYKSLLPLVSKVSKGLEELKKANPEFFKEILQKFTDFPAKSPETS